MTSSIWSSGQGDTLCCPRLLALAGLTGQPRSSNSSNSYRVQATALDPGTNDPAQGYNQPPVIYCVDPGKPKRGVLYTASIPRYSCCSTCGIRDFKLSTFGIHVTWAVRQWLTGVEVSLALRELVINSRFHLSNKQRRWAAATLKRSWTTCSAV